MVVSAGCDCSMVMWDLRTNKSQKPITSNSGPVYAVRFNEKGDQLISVNDDK